MNASIILTMQKLAWFWPNFPTAGNTTRGQGQGPVICQEAASSLNVHSRSHCTGPIYTAVGTWLSSLSFQTLFTTFQSYSYPVLVTTRTTPQATSTPEYWLFILTSTGRWTGITSIKTGKFSGVRPLWPRPGGPLIRSPARIMLRDWPRLSQLQLNMLRPFPGQTLFSVWRNSSGRAFCRPSSEANRICYWKCWI